MQLNRRTVLGAVAGGLSVGVAGCTSGGNGGNEGNGGNGDGAGTGTGAGSPESTTGASTQGGGTAQSKDTRADLNFLNARPEATMVAVTVTSESGETVFDKRVQLGGKESEQSKKVFQNPLKDEKTYTIEALVVNGPAKTFQWKGGKQTGVVFYIYPNRIQIQAISS